MMLREGHLGLGLLLFAPVGGVLLWLERWILFGVSLWPVLVGTVLPDLDLRLPVVSHRGWTHTVWFVLFLVAAGPIIGVVSTVVSNHLIADVSGTFTLVSGAIVGTLFGTALAFGVATHILGDVVTPRGVKLFTPPIPGDIGGIDVSQRTVSLDLVKADNQIMNRSLLMSGGIALLAVVSLVIL